jgi:hypothetical protein
LSVAHACCFGFREGGGLCRLFLRPAAADGVGRARPQINVDIVEIAHNILVRAESRHHILLRRVHLLAPVRHDIEKVRIGHRLDRVGEGRRIARAQPIGPVADMAIGVIPAVARECVPIDRAVGSDIISRITVGIRIFSIFVVDGLGITWRCSQCDAAGKNKESGNEHF